MLYLDFDLYAPTKAALETFLPRMPKGAILAFDELNQALITMILPQVDIPVVRGLSALDAAKKFLTELEQGRVDRASLSDDFGPPMPPDVRSGIPHGLSTSLAAASPRPPPIFTGMPASTGAFRAAAESIAGSSRRRARNSTWLWPGH